MRSWHITVAILLACGMPEAGASAQLPASWLVTEVDARSDNQPRRLLRLTGEYGQFVSPSVTIAGIAAMTLADASMDGAAASTKMGDAALRVNAGSHIFSGFAGAGVSAAEEGSLLTWDAGAAAAIGAGVSLRAQSKRTRYLATSSSLDTLVILHTVQLVLDRSNAAGWAGAAALRRDDHGDSNPVRSAYAWLLAPVIRRADGSLHIGYSLSRQDTEQSTWTRNARRGPPAGSAAEAGYYQPYYTPHDVTMHSVLAEAAVLVGTAWFKLNASGGVHATELAPELRSSGQASVVTFTERSFTPYEIRAVIARPLNAVTSLEARAGHSRTAYYNESTLSVRMARSLGSRE